MFEAPADPERLTLYGSFTSSSSYKPMLFLALARLPFSFRTVNLKNGVQKTPAYRSEEHTSELQSLMRSSYAVFCLKKKNSAIRNSRIDIIPRVKDHD